MKLKYPDEIIPSTLDFANSVKFCACLCMVGCYHIIFSMSLKCILFQHLKRVA